MPASRNDKPSEMMSFLLHLRERFDSEEEFKTFVLEDLRKFIGDLRLLDIELTLRPNYGGQPVSHHSATRKLARH